ncbi:MAG TPA: hypothetical protein PKA95_14920, partial [Thermomicrobiales bacterium]|nr:hypothetical protein [Thermomicrobiales bacterium]
MQLQRARLEDHAVEAGGQQPALVDHVLQLVEDVGQAPQAAHGPLEIDGRGRPRRDLRLDRRQLALQRRPLPVQVRLAGGELLLADEPVLGELEQRLEPVRDPLQ